MECSFWEIGISTLYLSPQCILSERGVDKTLENEMRMENRTTIRTQPIICVHAKLIVIFLVVIVGHKEGEVDRLQELQLQTVQLFSRNSSNASVKAVIEKGVIEKLDSKHYRSDNNAMNG